MKTYKEAKIALIMGQSIEGCGVTRNAAEMFQWSKKAGVKFDIYSYDERMYNRRDAHEMDFISFTRENINSTVEKLNQYDIVMFNSYPSNKFEKQAIIDFYEKVIKGVTTIKVGFMHELNKTNIDKIPYLVGIMNEMDVIYNFGEETWFSQTISDLLPSKEIGKRTKKFTMWFNFEDLENNYRNKYSLDDKSKKLVYCSRWTTMKGPRRVLDLAPMLAVKDPEFKAELKGIERSIGAKFDIFDHPNTLDCTGRTPDPNSTGTVPVYGPYIREEGIDFMAKNLFIASFYRMPKAIQDYGDRMEYSQIESIAVGSIPVFDTNWGENNRTLDGQRYIDVPYSAIYSDEKDLEGTVEKLIEVANNKELQEKYRETSYKIAKQEFDANIVLPKMFNEILAIGKDTNKFKSEKDILQNLIEPDFYEEFLDLYEEYTNKNEIVVLGIRELTNNIFCILDGKKEQQIKAFKKSKRKNK
ncbi:alpha-glucosyltransferase [Bacillus phage G]|uniref:Gp306 n=1 Tax=Bacillus phage G TaxID=2884420 RepID=G3MA47_9CAUD|nr:alpha-glucosyltransferase [Bacillus phage G]AEO93565.1 gp306 [Bacillus phage G]